LAFAVNAAERGHRITLFDAAQRIGGQLNLARVVPGKDEFNQLLRYFAVRLEALEVDVRLGTAAERGDSAGGGV
jgi:2,4-dienoyl-CoA reductase (NADPH2)